MGEDDVGGGIVLRVVSGAEAGPVRVGADGRVGIGRSASNELCVLDDGVSRRHCEVIGVEGGGHVVVDVGSTGGTWVNGVRVAAGEATPVSVGDLLTVGACLIRVAGEREAPATVRTIDDRTDTRTLVDRAPARIGAGRRLDALTGLFEALGRAGGEEEIARRVIDAALSGTGFGRGAFVRGDVESGSLEVVASAGRGGASAGEMALSRSLIERAGAGEVATLRASGGGGAGVVGGASVAEHGVRAAVCAPVSPGESMVEGYLYLDATDEGVGAGDDPVGYCAAVARVLALALGSARRSRVEARQREMRGHLEAAREAQRAILPRDEGRVGPVEYALRMRPGLFLAGDLFNVVGLSDGRAAVCLGDAAGHGPASAILMCAAQAFLQAELAAGASLGHAAAALNDYVCSIRTGGRFVTLWVGVFDSGGGLEYVDAGHGHVLRVGGGGVRRGGGATAPPVGVAPGLEFETVRVELCPDELVVLYSDGVVEQTNAEGEEFGSAGLEGVLTSLAAGDGVMEVVGRVSDALHAFAGSSAWRDDATVAAVRVV